jgi:3-oxoacyl-[acyl-carrier protein] reductase
MKKYNEIHVGDREKLFHTITVDDINRFVQLTGDDNRLHVNAEFAEKTPFKKPVVHGMLGASFISTIIGTKLPGDGALWFSQSLEFLLPVRIGDTLEVEAEVIKKYDREQFIELLTTIKNQNRQLVIRGTAKVKIIEQEVPIAEEALFGTTEKVVLVIGGTGGIGSETCRQLAKDGFTIAIHYNSNRRLAEKLSEELRVSGAKTLLVSADITNEAAVKEMVHQVIRKFGGIHVLVNCAAATIPNIKFKDLTWSDYLVQLELNIQAMLNLSKAIVPEMIEKGGGKLITIGSYAVDKPNSDWSHYITAKSALVGFNRSLAFELAPKGIMVNMVTPSLVNTELTADIPEKVKLLFASQTPLRRLALAKDVAGAISFLASDSASFMAGENIRVNGGQVMI